MSNEPSPISSLYDFASPTPFHSPQIYAVDLTPPMPFHSPQNHVVDLESPNDATNNTAVPMDICDEVPDTFNEVLYLV
jgi:hypothetical protein